MVSIVQSLRRTEARGEPSTSPDRREPARLERTMEVEEARGEVREDWPPISSLRLRAVIK